jgi:hypothetical protein
MRAIALGLLLLWPSLGCGGSSSETPPPLEPDATSSRYVGPRLPKPEDAPAKPAAPTPDEDDLPVGSQKPAAATWGSGKPTPTVPARTAPAPAPPAPAMTSPTASPAPSASPGAR